MIRVSYLTIMIPPISAEIIFHLGSIPVTNAMINAWIVAAFLIGLSFVLRKKTALVPKGLQNFSEAFVEFFWKQAESITGNRASAARFLPLAGAMFLIILANNWLGLLPGTGSIGRYVLHNGQIELLPILRPAASDLNLTVAMAIISVVATNILGIIAVGFFTHAGKFINFKGFRAVIAPKKSIIERCLAFFVAIIEVFAGGIEMISEVAKIFSLSLRLFGNIFAGEVLLTVIAGLFSFALPLPFMMLELLVGLIQASVFAILVLVYASIATSLPHGAEAHEAAK